MRPAVQDAAIAEVDLAAVAGISGGFCCALHEKKNLWQAFVNSSDKIG
jgi:hypothetical protein